MTTIKCDFCEKEIKDSTPTIKKTVRLDLNDSQPGHAVGVEIRVTSPGHRRFQHDICESCVYEAASLKASDEQPEGTVINGE